MNILQDASVAQINSEIFNLIKYLPSDKETKATLKQLIKLGYAKRRGKKYRITPKGLKYLAKLSQTFRKTLLKD